MLENGRKFELAAEPGLFNNVSRAKPGQVNGAALQGSAQDGELPPHAGQTAVAEDVVLSRDIILRLIHLFQEV